MVNKRIEIGLSDEDVKFIKWMAERDDVTFAEELRTMFYTELWHCKDLYMDEMKGEI